MPIIITTPDLIEDMNGHTLRTLARDWQLPGRSRMLVADLRTALMARVTAGSKGDWRAPEGSTYRVQVTPVEEHTWTSVGTSVDTVEVQGEAWPVEVVEQITPGYSARAFAALEVQEAENGPERTSQRAGRAFRSHHGSKSQRQARRRIERASRRRNRR